MAEEEVGLRLALKNRREVVDGVDDVGDKLDRAGDEADQLNRKSRLAAGGMLSLGKGGRIAGRAIVYGMGGAVTAVIGAGIVLGKLSKDAVTEAREAQKVGATTRAQIEATGRAAGVTARHIENLAGAISAKVGIDDEEIQSSANLVLAYTNVQNQVGKGNKIYDRATRAAVNMAAVTGTLTTNSKLLGKNLNDPLKAITGLSKAGVKWTDQQIRQIQADVKHNDILGAQKIILDEVEERFGGVAAAQATWGEKASVSFGNIKEKLGLVLLPMLDDVEKWFVQKGAPVLDHWVGIFEDRGIPTIEKYADLFRNKGIPAIGDFLDDARPLAKSVLPAIGTGLETAADAFKVIAPRAKSVFDAFNDLPDWAKSAIAISAGAAVVGKKAGLFDRTSLLGSIASVAKPLPVLVTNPGFGGVPGSPVGPGSGSKIPPIVPAAGGKFMSFLRSSPLALGTLLTGVTLASRSGTDQGTTFDHVGTEADYWKMVREEQEQTVGALDTLLVGPLGKTKQLRSDWTFLTANPADPRISERGMTGAVTAADGLMGLLGQIDHTDARPRVSVEGVGAALSAIGSVSDALLDVTSFFGGSTSGAPSSHDWSNLAPPKHRRRHPKLTGPRHPRHDPDGPVKKTLGSSFDDYFGDVPAPTGQPLHVHLEVGGREFGTAVIDNIDDQLARQ